MFEAGDRMAGWRVRSRLGSHVWHCHSEPALREAAVRLLYTPESPALSARIDALKHAHHPGIASIEEVRALDEYTLIAMTFAAGRSLAEIRPREPREIFSIARHLAESLTHLHTLRVCHGALRFDHVRIGTDKRPMLVAPWLPQRAPRRPQAPTPSIEDDISALAAILFALYTGRTAAGPLRGLDSGSVAPPPIRDWILRASSPGRTPPVSVLRERLIALEGTVAVSLPRLSPSAKRRSPRAEPVQVGPAPAAIAHPPRPVDPSLLRRRDDALPQRLLWLALIGLVGSSILPLAMLVLILLARAV